MRQLAPLVLGLGLCGAVESAAGPEPPAPASGAALVVLTGIGGEPRFAERFHAWAATLLDAAGARYGLPGSNLVYLAAEPDRDPDRARARSTREEVQATLRDLASKMPPGDTLFLVVIGHGSYRDGVSKVNLPGPDMTAGDFAAALETFGERPIVFANLTSASGGFLRRLSAPGRVVITATRNGLERNAAIFARFFVAAFVGDEADLDNDGSLTVLEAFNFARAEVERAYEGERKLQTEHAVLDDNGDGKGSDRPAIDADDGPLAAGLTLRGAPRATADLDPERTRLGRRKESLEQGISDLRQRKDQLSPEDYENQLEELLIQLALTHRALRALGDPTGTP